MGSEVSTSKSALSCGEFIAKATWAKFGFIQTLLAAALLLKALQRQKFESHCCRGKRRALVYVYRMMSAGGGAALVQSRFAVVLSGPYQHPIRD